MDPFRFKVSSSSFMRFSRDAAGFLGRFLYILVSLRRDLIFLSYSRVSMTTVDRPLYAGTTTIEACSLMLFSARKSEGSRFLAGGLAPWRIPTSDVLALCTAILFLASTRRRPSSTASMICGTGIFFGTGAKFRPLERTDFSASVSCVEDRFTTHISETGFNRPVLLAVAFRRSNFSWFILLTSLSRSWVQFFRCLMASKWFVSKTCYV